MHALIIEAPSLQEKRYFKWSPSIGEILNQKFDIGAYSLVHTVASSRWSVKSSLLRHKKGRSISLWHNWFWKGQASAKQVLVVGVVEEMTE